MSSAGKRQRVLYGSSQVGHTFSVADWFEKYQGKPPLPSLPHVPIGKQMTVSESNIRSPDGSYRSGGPFFTTREQGYYHPGSVKDAYGASTAQIYTGPVAGNAPSQAERSEVGAPKDPYITTTNVGKMTADGTTAISLCAPINPASNLGTTLAESVREGIPTLPGIQLWRKKVEALRGLGNEYLNYQFGWAPLRDEVSSVVDAARNHRDLLQAYQRGEGSDTHRTFEFSSQPETKSLPPQSVVANWPGLPWTWNRGGTRQVFMVKNTKRWFEGVFTYALPSSTDSWRKALGFGSDADQLFGIALTPDILWELTPWSWAVDWFSNASDVVNNVTNFGLAGLVMRYGYMMEEISVDIYAEGRCPLMDKAERVVENGTPHLVINKNGLDPGMYRNGVRYVTKTRIPASPFGFSIGWEGLSPTQLAITAALGITRLL